MTQPHSIPDELVSAYLDNELSQEEHEQVAKALQHDERLRQLLSDLKEVRAEVRSLPKHVVSTDFTRRVMSSAKGTTRATTKRKTPRRPITMVVATIATVMIAAWLANVFWPTDAEHDPVLTERPLDHPTNQPVDVKAPEVGIAPPSSYQAARIGPRHLRTDRPNSSDARLQLERTPARVALIRELTGATRATQGLLEIEQLRADEISDDRKAALLMNGPSSRFQEAVDILVMRGSSTDLAKAIQQFEPRLQDLAIADKKVHPRQLGFDHGKGQQELEAEDMRFEVVVILYEPASTSSRK